MASEKQLIYKDDARKAVLRANPSVAYCFDSVKPVDAVEVVHGRWDIEVGMNYNKERICPVCKKRIESNFWNYCPNCGAKMDGGNEDD